MKPDPATLAWAEEQARNLDEAARIVEAATDILPEMVAKALAQRVRSALRGPTRPYGEWRREMSALYTALLEGETKESLAAMVCELRGKQPTTERIDLGKNGVDDVAISGVEMFRLERMDKGCFWCACYIGNARHVFWIRAEKGNLMVSHDKEPR